MDKQLTTLPSDWVLGEIKANDEKYFKSSILLMLFFWGRNFMTLQSPLIENDELLCKIESNINVF